MHSAPRTYVIKASAAIALEAKHPLTLKSLQIFDILLAHAYNALGEYTDETSILHRMPLAQMYAALDGKISAWSDLKPHLQHLRSTAVQWNILGKVAGIEMESSSIAEFGRDRATDELLWSYPPLLARILYEPKIYSKLSLHELAQIGSKPHHRLFQLIEDYKNNVHGTGWIRLEDFQRFMGTNYPRWDNIKKRLIDEPIERINEQHEYIVSYDVQRSGNKVVAVKFTTTRKKTKAQAHKPHVIALPAPKRTPDYDALFASLSPHEQADIIQRTREQIPDFVRANYAETSEPWKMLFLAERNQVLDTLFPRSERNS